MRPSDERKIATSGAMIDDYSAEVRPKQKAA